MGTTFIKLGQFLVTRPDIIGDELAKQLEGFAGQTSSRFLYLKQKKLLIKI
jgi:ubiquinone biosynthesis protein